VWVVAVEFATDDSIVAIATPPGRGGIGVVRIGGPSAQTIALQILGRNEQLTPRHATFARITAGRPLTGRHEGLGDEVVATYFQAPHSYTGQDIVEISAHGSPVVLNAIVRAAMNGGARLARPGEFTLRAFLNGKRDLVQAEAVGDLIAAATPLQARVAFDQLEGTLTRRIAEVDRVLFDLIAKLEASLDFPDEGYHFVTPAEVGTTIGHVIRDLDQLLVAAGRGRMIREGATVVFAGRPNVGKSSLFNVLAGVDRAIVTNVPGTTRDLVTEIVDIEGIAVTLVDTAGWSASTDVVETEGVLRGQNARGIADLIVVVVDQSEALSSEDRQLLEATASQRRLVVLNKADLVDAVSGFGRTLRVSATTGAGIEDLRCAIAAALAGDDALRDTASISNTRHIRLLEEARTHLNAAQVAAQEEGTPEEFVLTDLQAARAKFDEVVGVRTSEDVLAHIFENFCIGK